jgi:hypothetical protein
MSNSLVPSVATREQTQEQTRGPTSGQAMRRTMATGMTGYPLVTFGLAWLFWIPDWLAGLKDTGPRVESSGTFICPVATVIGVL